MCEKNSKLDSVFNSKNNLLASTNNNIEDEGTNVSDQSNGRPKHPTYNHFWTIR